MLPVKGVLLDVYDTALTCDFQLHASELARLAGVPAEPWARARRLSQGVTTGHLTFADAFALILRECGVEPSPDLIERLVRCDEELLLQGAIVYDDTLRFLRDMRARGIRVAIVSNCAENTRNLLEHVGITELVDAVVLSCDVGFAKPSPEIYAEALRQLELSADEVLFVDDQESYCKAASCMGMGALRMCRGGQAIEPNDVRSLTHVVRHVDARQVASAR